MREILLKNKDIINRLEGFSDIFLKLKPENLPIGNRDPYLDPEYATSEEYMNLIIDKGMKHKGPPESIKAVDLAMWSHDGHDEPLSKEWQEFVNDVAFSFPREMGIQQNAITGYYPPGGYIGWHDNHDAPGFTLLFNWSQDGNGFYRFRDPITHEVVTIPDKKGWSCKSGYYGVVNDDRGNKQQWTYHCASTNSPRWAIAFYIKDRTIWNMIIEEIEDDDEAQKEFNEYLKFEEL